MLYGGNRLLFRAAREAGMSTSIDLNWDPQWGVSPQAEVDRRKQAIREVLPWVDLVHGNVRELNEFAGCGDLEVTMRRVVDCGAGVCMMLQHLLAIPVREKLSLANRIVSWYIEGTLPLAPEL